MIHRFLPLAFGALTGVLSTFAAPALAVDIFAADGAWIGQGQIATGAVAPLERGRCKVSIAPASAGSEVSITGKCAVSAGASNISMKVVRGAGGKVSAGVWSAATGQTVQLSGVERAGDIRLTSTSPLDVEGQAYETRVDVVAPDAAHFSIRQLLRPVGETAWRLVVDMTYAKAP